ncbi:DUF3500 domain-containing protein [Streptomyces sp. NEAU-YJ-81]|uniref:DUF3500 domain-containing protein n=1 Tax=Streptomyces sp. NEAU-YJ-81 TaxID=2820288 RepID=UPI0027E0238D|nr:DUF3500 domain-containing protein [Streptomyces sp. NEAU-YJ-81]
MGADLGELRQMPAELGAAAKTVAQAMSRAAMAWLADLDDEQRTLAWWGPPGSEHEAERRRWFYTPTDHGGLAFNAQFAWQQRRAMQLVASGLSPEGYDLVSTIIGTENILDRVEGFGSEFDTRRGRDPSRYYLRVFGDPEGGGVWGWRFGGHHISLNFLVVAGEVRSATPRFFGLDPAVTTLPGGVRLDPLGAFQSTARDLVTSLSPDARAEAVLLDRAPADIVMGNRSSFEEGATMMNLSEIFRRRPGDDELMERMRRGGNALDRQTGYGPRDHALLSVTSVPKGIPGTDLDRGQRDLLDLLMRTYHDGLPDGLAPRWAIDELHFAWAGSLEAGVANYYRVQGGGFLIEWDNTARGGNHAHGVVRHLSNDFGGDVLAGHRQAWHSAETAVNHHYEEDVQS